MIRLTYPLFSRPIEINENQVNVIVIENPRYFREFFFAVKKSQNRDSSSLVISKDFEEVAFEKYCLPIFSLENIDLNSKKIIGKIISNLKANAISENYYKLTNELLVNIDKFIISLIETSEFPLIFNSLDIESILKNINLKIYHDSQSFISIICDYLDIVSDLLGVQVFIFFHLKSFFEKDEILSLYKHCFYKKINIILVESYCAPKYDNENLLIIDKDLCLI